MSKRTRANEQKPIRLAILWHQHQPYYRAGDTFVMPWAWLHATKDYLEMAQHLERHPNVHATINLVPSLLKQLDGYLTKSARDPVLELMTKPAAELTPEEQDYLIDNFFLANPHTVISRSPRYQELYERLQGNPEETSEKRHRMSEQDYRDLAVHYSLGWTGEIARREEPFRSLVEKDRDYTEEDKQTLMAAQYANVARIVPLHRELAERKQVELTTTPFYHPILPLLVDAKVARQAMPDVGLPLQPIAWPEEAERQLHDARRYFKAKLELTPAGLWPSEGSISDAVLRLAAEQGFRWTATDEAVLARSLGNRSVVMDSTTLRNEHRKYVPWKYATPSGDLTLFFRDHRLSDNIGFTYQSWRAEDAVGDLMHRVEQIREDLVEHYGEGILDVACVSIILDGENCWEYYPDNGYEFLDGLYGALESSSLIRTVSFSEVLASTVRARLPKLDRVVAGSWINANFRIWIGHPEDNAAWDLLVQAKDTLDRYRERLQNLKGAARAEAAAQIEQAQDELMIAEGSDWCWWYGDDHFSAQKDTFDELYRMHLRAMYVHLDARVPEILMRPMEQRTEIYQIYHRPSESQERQTSEPPSIAGKLLNDSWIGVPNAAPAKVFGAMHKAVDFELDDMKLAIVGEESRFRIVLSPGLPETDSLEIVFEEPQGLLVHLSSGEQKVQAPYAEHASVRAVIDETVEFALPLDLLAGTKQLRFHIEVLSQGKEVTRIPEHGSITCEATVVG